MEKYVMVIDEGTTGTRALLYNKDFKIMKVEDKEQNREEYLKDVDIFVTNRCNSNCIMCPLSETVRRKSDHGRIEEIFQQLKELPENVEYVNVTGGEPTLVGQAFFEIMDKLKMKFQNL